MIDQETPMMIALTDILGMSLGEDDAMAITIKTHGMKDNGVFLLGDCDRDLPVQNILLDRDMIKVLIKYCEEALND